MQHFEITKKFTVKAVDGVSFENFSGEGVRLVGRVGLRQVHIGRSVIRLYEPPRSSITFVA